MIAVVTLLAQADVDEGTQKETLLVVLLSLVVGIAVVGVILVAMVAIWGSRTRRLSREGLPEVRDPDPFAAMRAEARKNEAASSSESAAAHEDDEDRGDKPDGGEPDNV